MRVLNTDAEGRLLLADALWYTQDRFKLAALGQHQVGLFSNDGKLSASLVAVGAAVDERLWPMPLGEEYDKQIESDIAGVAWSEKVRPTVPKGGTGYGVCLLDRLVADNYEN